MNSPTEYRYLPFLRFWPIIAVFVGLNVLQSGWLAIFLYHLGIVVAMVLTKTPWKSVMNGFRAVPAFLFWLGGVLAAPSVFFLLPVFLDLSPAETGEALRSGLAKAGLSGMQFYLFALYLCLPHPGIEELGWRRLLFVDSKYLHFRDFEFASYHLLVMHFFFPHNWPFFLICFFSLAMMAWIWRLLRMKYGGLAIPTWFHAGGDLGVMLGVWWLIR